MTKFPSYADLFGSDHQDKEWILTPWGELELNPYFLARCPRCGGTVDARGCHNLACQSQVRSSEAEGMQ